MRVSGDRIHCVVPYCRRTAPAEKYPDCEIICAKHWPMISQETRRRKASAERRHRKYERRWSQAAREKNWDRMRKLERILRLTYAACQRTWEACKQEAIEGAAGIA